MRPRVSALSSALFAVVLGCDVTQPDDVLRYRFEFSTGSQGWTSGFADVAVSQEGDVQFVADHRQLPAPFPGFGLYHAGLNVSDDLFMFFARRVDGLAPGTHYHATFEVEFLSNAGRDCDVGVGSSVWVKAGASPVAPQRVIRDGYYRMNVDKGEQQNDGADARLLGDIRHALPGCPSSPEYGRHALTSTNRPLEVRAAADGSLWLLMATESGFEVAHHLYFTKFTATLRRTE